MKRAAAEAAPGDSKDAAPAQPRLQPECRVIIYNVAKKQNIGNIVRSAVAFGVSEFIIVGKGKVNTFGNKDTNKFIRFTFFETLPACKESLKKEGFSIVGIEIGEKAKDVCSHPFTGPTAFILGNEGQGLNEKALGICDQLVFIPQYGSGTASLNVSVAAAIVLHHFAVWAKYPEAARTGQKFVVDESKVVGPGRLMFKKQKTKHAGSGADADAASDGAAADSAAGTEGDAMDVSSLDSNAGSSSSSAASAAASSSDSARS